MTTLVICYRPGQSYGTYTVTAAFAATLTTWARGKGYLVWQR